jgi:hypothetical protein
MMPGARRKAAPSGGPEDAASSAPVARLPSQLSDLRPKWRLFSAGTPVIANPQINAPRPLPAPKHHMRIAPSFAPAKA